MALALTAIDLNPVSKTFTAIGTQDGSVAAQSIFCGFTPKVINVYRTDTAGNGITILNTTAPGVVKTMVGVTLQLTAAGVTSIVSSNPGVLLSGYEASPAAAASGQASQPASSAGFTLGTGCLTASSTVFIVAEG